MTMIVCCAYPLGYGPAAKLHVIAEELQRRGVHTVFLGTGVTHEFAAHSRSGIAVEADPDDARARAVVAASDAVLSLMDRDYVRVAQELGKPYFVVDSLVWLRERIPEEFLASRRYWVQDFVGVRERLAETSAGAIVVGPVVRSMPRASEGGGTELVVSLGGLASPYQGDEGGVRYAEFVVEGLLRSEMLRPFQGRALVMGGRRCIEHLRRRHAGTRLDFATLSHASAVARLRRAALVVSAPGLTTALECFQLGVPTFFLPPQNYSQWWILKTLRARDLAPCSFHWEDRPTEHPITERMPEATRVPLLRDLLTRSMADREVARGFDDALAGVPAVDRRALASRQWSFFRSLGANATAAIAAEMQALC